VNGAVGETDVEAVTVGGRVHGDGLGPELAASADDADGHLAAVGDQDALEHRLSLAEIATFRASHARFAAIG
jgi:hypothetical protein